MKTCASSFDQTGRPREWQRPASEEAGVALFARFARARVLQIRNERFVQSAREFGTGPLQSLLRHVLPNLARAVTALALIEFAHVVLSISVLRFLGYGVEPPNPEGG